MRQRVVVQIIMRRDDKVLLLRRANGAPATLDKYEFPGGQVDYGEQPIDASIRHLRQAIGLELSPKDFSLYDVMSYINSVEADDSQYVLVLYTINQNQKMPVALNRSKYSRYRWQPTIRSRTRTIPLRYSATLILSVLETGNTGIAQSSVKEVVMYTDGGSRGNPGPSATGFIIFGHDDHVIWQGGRYIGISDSGYAEYAALQQALERALALGVVSVSVRMDSSMAVEHVNSHTQDDSGDFSYREINNDVKQLLKRFKSWDVQYVPREQNTLADGLVNKILDDQTDK